MNRVKGLALLNNMLAELQTKFCNIVQEAANKTISKEKKRKEKQGGKVVILGGFTNSGRMKRSEKQGKTGSVNPIKCRVSMNS